MWQITADAHSDATQNHCKKNASHETLSQHFSCSNKIVRAYFMCYLNVETYANCCTQAAEEPNAGADETDACAGLGTKTAYHAGVDVLHHDVYHLCHHAGETKQGGKLDL